MTITEKTVSEIATENPHSVRVFETLGIDYCCGGKRTLSDACAGLNVPMERVLELLATVGQEAGDAESIGWNKAALSDLIAHIVTKHHGFVRQETPRLDALLTKVVSRHGTTHPEVRQIASLFEAVSQEMSTHMLKEEQVLFPHIERMELAARDHKQPPAAFFGSVKRPVANMVADHDDAGAVLAQMRELSTGYAPPSDACPTFRALYQGLEDYEHDLHRHVHLENNILFPRAIAMEREEASGTSCDC